MDILLSPPIAFLLYIPLVGIIALFGKMLSGPAQENKMKSSIYGSGEEAPIQLAAPGYRPLPFYTWECWYWAAEAFRRFRHFT
jgi:NADH:ubiquinone oxidoreductase subunit 3 (subunit A)